MFLIVAVVLAVIWGLGALAFHVGGGLIHLLLIVARIAVVVHVVRGTRGRAYAQTLGVRLTAAGRPVTR